MVEQQRTVVDVKASLETLTEVIESNSAVLRATVRDDVTVRLPVGRSVVLVGENAEDGQSVAVFDVPADWCEEDVDRFVQAHSDVWDTAAVVQRRTAEMPA